MADVKATRASRASMNWATVQSQGASGDQSARRNITFEAQRKTAGPAAIALYARKNPAINPARTHLNVDMVNDGAGGFRETGDIEEVVRYGDERVAQVAAKLNVGNRVATTTVYHAPWAYLEPDGTTYQAVDKNGDPKFFASGPREGEPVMLPRYRVKPEHRDEMDSYFAACLEAHADIAPGGHDAIHGYSINLDESRPHLQVLGDPFTAAPSKKNPDALKNGYSKAFGRHPSDGLVPSLDGEGQPVLLADGSAKLVKDTASTKMQRYHAEFKQRMIDQGFAVCRERDEARHDRHLELGDFKDLQHDRAAVEETAEWLADERVAASLDVAAEFEALAERAQELKGEEFEVRVEERKLAAARATAAKAGRAEGYETGYGQGRQALADREADVAAKAQRVEGEAARRTAERILAWEETELPGVVDAARTAARDAVREGMEADRQAAADDRQAAERERERAREHADSVVASVTATSVTGDMKAALHDRLTRMQTAAGEPVLATALRGAKQDAASKARASGMTETGVLRETVRERDARVQGITADAGRKQAAARRQSQAQDRSRDRGYGQGD